MAHTIYENQVLENKIESLLATAIDMNAYMTIDNSFFKKGTSFNTKILQE